MITNTTHKQIIAELDTYGAEFYDYHATRDDIPFYVNLARESGGPVLETGCGTGRVLLPVARAGVAITGLELSPLMLNVCRQKLQAEPPDVQARVHLVQGDMRQFDLGRTFSLVMIPFGPFQYLTTVAEQLACLASIHRHLQPGGRLVIDVSNPLQGQVQEHAEAFTLGDPFRLPDGRLVTCWLKNCKIDRRQQVIMEDMMYAITYPDGAQEQVTYSSPLRYYFRFEMEHLLARGGFRVETVYENFEKNADEGQASSDYLIFSAQKGEQS